MGHADISNQLNATLDSYDLGTPSGTLDLEGLPDLFRDVLPLWWEHTDTDYASIAVKAGTASRTYSPLIDREALFTACATAAVKSLRERLARDSVRHKRYHAGHEDLLTLAFDLRADSVETTYDATLIDGTPRRVPASATRTLLTFSNFPILSTADDFDVPGDYNRVSHRTTVSYEDQTAALRAGWRQALTIATHR